MSLRMRASRAEIGHRTSLALVGECCQATRKPKTPAASEDTDGVFRAFTSFELLHSNRQFRGAGFVPAYSNYLARSEPKMVPHLPSIPARKIPVPLQPSKNACVI